MTLTFAVSSFVVIAYLLIGVGFVLGLLLGQMDD